MARTHVVSIGTNITPEQKQAFDEARALSGLTEAEFLRLAIAREVFKSGVAWPIQSIKHGGKRNYEKNVNSDETT